MKVTEHVSVSLPETIHLVGIGGIGLSAIARVLAAWGHKVQGSDLRETDITRELQKHGIKTFVGQKAEQIAGADLVVMSSAVPLDNPEILAARRAGIPIMKRHKLLGEMLKGRTSIGFAGTHGKTTTSAMCATVLHRLDQDPTFIVGGILEDLRTNAAAGSGPYFVIEADEYDRTFHGLHPNVAVVTNIEMDHPDCYADLQDMQEAYRLFLDNKRPGGTIVACIDSPGVRYVLPLLDTDSEIRTYGFNSDAAYRLERSGSHCLIWHKGRVWQEFDVAVPGEHNALNATAVILALDSLELERRDIARQIALFKGVHRRLEKKGETAGIAVYDDYAHHPTEIQATLGAVREIFPRRKVWAVFQPHTFSRTEALWKQFCGCFQDADRVILVPVFAARSRENETVTSDELARSIRHDHVHYCNDAVSAQKYLMQNVRRGDLVITLGAGDGCLIGERLLQEMDAPET